MFMGLRLCQVVEECEQILILKNLKILEKWTYCVLKVSSSIDPYLIWGLITMWYNFRFEPPNLSDSFSCCHYRCYAFFSRCAAVDCSMSICYPSLLLDI